MTPLLRFGVESAEAVEFAAAPTLALKLRVEELQGIAIRSISLMTQVRIAARQRVYSRHERARLVDVFGETQQWATSLHSVLWTQLSSVVTGFRESVLVDVHVPCTYDFEIVSARYLHALDSGTVPLELLFSGTVFYETESQLRVERISWDQEARFDLPVSVWRAAVEAVFPNSAWLRIPRETFDRLASFRARQTLPGWDAALDKLLQAAEAEAVAP